MSAPLRSIPARAGETLSFCAIRGLYKVYPRTGGGNRAAPLLFCSLRGLSPHGRGKLICCWRRSGRRRSIPARAGETKEMPEIRETDWVYPRTGGGNPA